MAAVVVTIRGDDDVVVPVAVHVAGRRHVAAEVGLLLVGLRRPSGRRLQSCRRPEEQVDPTFRDFTVCIAVGALLLRHRTRQRSRRRQRTRTRRVAQTPRRSGGPSQDEGRNHLERGSDIPAFRRSSACHCGGNKRTGQLRTRGTDRRPWACGPLGRVLGSLHVAVRTCHGAVDRCALHTRTRSSVTRQRAATPSGSRSRRRPAPAAGGQHLQRLQELDDRTLLEAFEGLERRRDGLRLACVSEDGFPQRRELAVVEERGLVGGSPELLREEASRPCEELRGPGESSSCRSDHGWDRRVRW